MNGIFSTLQSPMHRYGHLQSQNVPVVVPLVVVVVVVVAVAPPTGGHWPATAFSSTTRQTHGS